MLFSMKSFIIDFIETADEILHQKISKLKEATGFLII